MNENITQTRATGAIEMLISDHQTIKSLLTQLTRSSDSGTRKQTLEELKGLLTIHNSLEENIVYPALAQIARKHTESMHLYEETAAADVLIFEIDTMLKENDDSDFTAKAETLQKAVFEHIEDEEQKAFRDLREKAEPQEMQMLDTSAQEFRRKFRFDGAGERATMRAETGEIRSD
ncbi:MAG: hemerythrin domain-containing protein [Candidatus Baltobacteraceae bacterium]